jgi:hypothetical protein
VERDAQDDRQDHRAEDGNAWKLPQRDGEAGDRTGEAEAWPNLGRVPQSGTDRRVPRPRKRGARKGEIGCDGGIIYGQLAASGLDAALTWIPMVKQSNSL